MTDALRKQKGRREYRMHGDCHRIRRLKQAGIDAIDGRSRAGREAKAWRAWALKQKGAMAGSKGVRERIDEATFLHWRRLCLRDYIVLDAKKRGTVVNRRNGRLPKVHEQYDAISARFEAIRDALNLDKSPNPFGDLGGLG